MEPVGPRAALECEEVMTGYAAIVRCFIAGGAVWLPLLAFGHGSEFLDAKFFLDDQGRANLEITADYGSNPMISSEQEARSALASALCVASSAGEQKLADLAPLKIEPRARPDPESPAPRGPEDPQTPHQLLTARWQWQPATESLTFSVPKDSMQTVLFWMREPHVSPPRWSMLIPGDSTPLIPLPPRPLANGWWCTLLLLPLGGWWWRRSSNHSRRSPT